MHCWSGVETAGVPKDGNFPVNTKLKMHIPSEPVTPYWGTYIHTPIGGK